MMKKSFRWGPPVSTPGIGIPVLGPCPGTPHLGTPCGLQSGDPQSGNPVISRDPHLGSPGLETPSLGILCLGILKSDNLSPEASYYLIEKWICEIASRFSYNCAIR